MTNLKVKEIAGGVVFDVKVVPGSSKTAFGGLLGDMLKVKVAAAAQKGKANQCLIEFLTQQLGVKRKAVSITAGITSPVKQIRITGITAEDLLRLLNLK